MMQKSTPLLIYATRHGTLYNLTPTNQPKSINAVQLSYGDLHDYKEIFRNLPEGMTLKKFLSFPENTIIYLTPYDFSKSDCMNGCYQDTKVKIKCNKGYIEVTAKLYDEMIQLIKPDYFVSLTQCPSLQKDHKQQSNKSYKRAINKTKSYLELSSFTKSQQECVNSNYQRIAALHGGTNLSLIARSLEQILDYAIDGIVVCDLCQNQSAEEREIVYKTIIERLDQEYTREGSFFKNKKLKLILGGLGKIKDIQHAIKFGFQSFQINYPFILAEKQVALIYESQSNYRQHAPTKRQDLRPLDPNCKCSTCINYSESYIAHLIDCHQLTGKILLSIHNLHQYQSWEEKQKQ